MNKLELNKLLKRLKRKEVTLEEKIAQIKRRKGEMDGPRVSWSSTLQHDMEDQISILEGEAEKTKSLIEELASLPKPKRKDEVSIGSWAKLKMNDEEKKFLLTETQSDPEEGVLSSKTRLGKALLGRKVGESFEVQAPQGKVGVKILEII